MTEVPRGCTTAGRRGAYGQGRASRTTVRRLDVRSGDANRRRVGLEQSCRRLAVGHPRNGSILVQHSALSRNGWFGSHQKRDDGPERIRKARGPDHVQLGFDLFHLGSLTSSKDGRAGPCGRASTCLRMAGFSAVDRRPVWASTEGGAVGTYVGTNERCAQEGESVRRCVESKAN
jgi:hypothetical protein